ncbi:hypothetical protein CaCOL14_013424 [Colletotrichum acutatum]
MEGVICNKDACIARVLSIFPDIDLQHLEKIAANVNYDPTRTVDAILEIIEKVGSYPKASCQRNLKRKREESTEDEDANTLRHYAKSERKRRTSMQYVDKPREILKHDTAQVSQWRVPLISDLLNCLQKTPTSDRIHEGKKLDQLAETVDPVEKRALKEPVAASRMPEAAGAKRKAATILVCGCCYGEFALNRMVCCKNGNHFFCVDCARRNAETVVGLSKFEITCMSTDGCDAGFAHQERARFIDHRLSQALDRIEFEANLQMAGIDDLETCPFCPYAAEYPSVGINKEFKCENPDCHVVSCRLCREETHIPRTCAEAATENSTEGDRRQIEEAMSTALIRKCNKCGTAFVKESGCNKMTCTKRGCKNVQCYVCSKSCDYAHFDDKSRGGRKGNCPLFDDVETRHNKEVQQAEAKAHQKILEHKANSAPTVPKKNRSKMRAV